MGFQNSSPRRLVTTANLISSREDEQNHISNSSLYLSVHSPAVLRGSSWASEHPGRLNTRRSGASERGESEVGGRRTQTRPRPNASSCSQMGGRTQVLSQSLLPWGGVLATKLLNPWVERPHLQLGAGSACFIVRCRSLNEMIYINCLPEYLADTWQIRAPQKSLDFYP